MATDRTILRLGKQDEGSFVSAEDFAEAEFSEPWRHECEGGRLVVLAPSGEGHIEAGKPWRDQLVLYKLANPSRLYRVVNEAWVRVDGGTDRIGDIGVYFVQEGPKSRRSDRVPELIFEIVSPDRLSRDRDYQTKRLQYQALGVQEYVVIDRFSRTVTVMRFAPNRADERILKSVDRYESPLLLGLSITLSDVL